MTKTLIIFTLLIFSHYGYGQQPLPKSTVQKMLIDFYVQYNTAWSTIKDNAVLIKRLDYLRRSFCTPSLYQKLRKDFETDGLDHDALINDEYTNVINLHTIKVNKVAGGDNRYVVSYMDSTLSPSYKPVYKKVIIYIEVALVNGQYKIAKVR